MFRQNKIRKKLLSVIALGGFFFMLRAVVLGREKDKKINEENPYLENQNFNATFGPKLYEKYIKPIIDRILSLIGLVILFPAFCLLAAVIFIDDPGPVFFTQKRVGKNKEFFYLHKFRTMKMCTPHDVPTHQLSEPDQYITRVGRVLRRCSLDELPQLWDIFRGKMSIIGPRPALWNQEDLVAERDKAGANRLFPGLTGLAQIMGRDELNIAEKAKLDGQYAAILKSGNMKGFFMDIRCFLGTIGVVLKHDGVVEGGTGELQKKIIQEDKDATEWKKSILVVCQYYFPENFQITPICESLVRDGYKVTVLTGLPNYPVGIVPEKYKYGHREEIINGVHVIRCYEAGRKKGAVNLAFNYGSFLMSSMKKAGELGCEFDLVFCYQLSPVFMGLPARKYARKHKVPLLLYCCDIWPESVKMYIQDEKNPVFKIVKDISRQVYQSADRVIVQSTSFISYLRKTHRIERNKISYIPAFADEAYLKEDFSMENGTTDFMFLGNLGIAQDLISVLEAVKIIRDIPGLKVHFVGDGVCLEQMKRFVKAESLENIVTFYGRRPVEEMPIFYKLADICLVSLKADNATGYTLPSKVQGYMAAGKPILGMIDGSARDIIEESECGICVSAGDINGLAKAMRTFMEEPEKYKDCGMKGREYFMKNFAKAICIAKIENEIEEVSALRR
ncbi:MAG: glycosyltransferase [Lachnospiraceae bacterium]|jgi:lipopolysaccharide/colanic/teichoic acid biosynthesis glycosyltransferase/glycosyltransferase involved in cell wall biosynthesis|nr:glycosyltransferase [Lachnospiraceae bacterium]